MPLWGVVDHALPYPRGNDRGDDHGQKVNHLKKRPPPPRNQQERGGDKANDDRKCQKEYRPDRVVFQRFPKDPVTPELFEISKPDKGGVGNPVPTIKRKDNRQKRGQQDDGHVDDECRYDKQAMHGVLWEVDIRATY